MLAAVIAVFMLFVALQPGVVMAQQPIAAQPTSPPAEQLLLLWQVQQGQLNFQQQKWIRGLQRPLQSSGFLQLEPQRLLWVTEKPIQQQVVLDKLGVQQQLAGELKLQPGTELIGTLMLAVMQQDIAFLQQHFAFESAAEHCVRLIPRQKPLTAFYQHIELCGAIELQQITLLELSGNRSEIVLSPGVAK